MVSRYGVNEQPCLESARKHTGTIIHSSYHGNLPLEILGIDIIPALVGPGLLKLGSGPVVAAR